MEIGDEILKTRTYFNPGGGGGEEHMIVKGKMYVQPRCNSNSTRGTERTRRR